MQATYPKKNAPIQSIIREAWHKVAGIKRKVFISLIILIVIEAVITLIIREIQLIGATPVPASMALHTHNALIVETIRGQWVRMAASMAFLSMLLSLLSSIFVGIPLRAGFLLMGLRRAVDKTIQVHYLFQFFRPRYLWRFFLLSVIFSIIFSLLSFVGLLLVQAVAADLGNGWAILFGILAAAVLIYFFVGISLALPIIIDQKSTAWRAVVSSYSTVTRHWWCVFVLMLFTVVINLIGLIPLGIGLIWTIPLTVNIYGILYRVLFGIHGRDPVTQAEAMDSK